MVVKLVGGAVCDLLFLFHQVSLIVELLHQSLMLGVGPASPHPQLISHAPEATTARFRYIDWDGC